MSAEQRTVREAASDPQQLEKAYRAALRAGRDAAFAAAIQVLHEERPDDPLIQAWHYRLQPDRAADDAPARRTHWPLAVPISILTGLIYWALSDLETGLILGGFPRLVLWWSPIATMSALVFLALASRVNLVRAAALGLAPLGAAGYAQLLGPGLSPAWISEQYLGLAVIHIPLLCWTALGVFILGRRSEPADRAAFLIKSIEVMITAGLYLIFGMVFGGITVGMFAALGIDLPEIWMRLIAAGGFGLLPVLAVASVYDPEKPPARQNFDQGLSRFIATMMRLLLPLTLGVLAIYILVIPFNFLAPFEDRDVLIVFNLMLFGIIGLLLGATPIRGDDLSPDLQRWLRRGILAVAVLAGLVSLYALAAVVYRTVDGGMTINRMTVIGWNGINIGILAALVIGQLRGDREDWIAGQQAVFGGAASWYAVWGLFLLLAVPWLFR